MNGETIGAFDREHGEIVLPASDRPRVLSLLVERRAIPTNGLPSGNNLKWWWINHRAHPKPSDSIEIRPAPEPSSTAPAATGIVLWGHSHLDVAWLWTYEEAARKAVRTFANALALMEFDPTFVFTQSQPQLYAFVRDLDPELFARVQTAVTDGRWDVSTAALWLEPDCNLPSGESLVRQALYGYRFCVDAFAVVPTIAWLPDTFGFAGTLPTILAHCGIERFATTKLMWNDTNAFPHPQFVWRGRDGSEVLGALFASYEGGIDSKRVEAARDRNEPLVVGYGDGGGGVTLEHLDQTRGLGRWEKPSAWFDRLEQRRTSLPVHDDELYLEYHRGVYTTHHDAKAENASLERALAVAEEQAAWCVAVHAPSGVIDRMRDRLQAAWRIVLRNQFHDVLPGTSIAPVYVDAAREYAIARAEVELVVAAATSVLPRARGQSPQRSFVAPRIDGDEYVFENDVLRARLSSTGSLVELSLHGAPNVVTQANVLATYRDRPKKWDAWNIEADYPLRRRAAKPKGSSVVDDGLEIRFLVGRSPATMRVSLAHGERMLRVELAIAWRESHTLLRCENWLPLGCDRVAYGAPHGSIERGTGRGTPHARARFEVPGQRFAFLRGATAGLAILTLDTYGWDARQLSPGGTRIGHSLLRSTSWPDPGADRGEHRLIWGYAPFAQISEGEVEATWEQFAYESRVRLFRGEGSAVIVAALKPAEDGRGVILRVRECDGMARTFSLRCGARMRSVTPVDGLERTTAGDAEIVRESLVATIGAHAIRSFRVEF